MHRALVLIGLALVLVPTAAGSVRLYGGSLAVVDDPYGPPRLVDLTAGRVHALYPAGRSFSLGSGFANPAPTRGRARFDPHGATIAGRRVPLLPLRSIPVRFRSDGATLAGTLLIPPGSGRRAAVAYVTGSGPTTREYLPELQALLLHDGVAVLAYDKRGVGASSGSYPGESPTDAAIDQLARDAAAAARFLAARPEVDPERVGLAGHSQAGWIMPLAGTRAAAPCIRKNISAVRGDSRAAATTMAMRASLSSPA
jgi:hypothetical protein